MNNKILIPTLLGVAAVFGILIGMLLDFPNKRIALTQNEVREQKVKQIIDYVDFEYVDQVNTDSILDITIKDLLRKLDPHSTYIPISEVAANEESMRGSFEGIGIEFKIFRDTLAIVNVLEGGPSSRAGLKAGNRILFADNQRLFGEGITAEKIIGSLKGKSGTKVKLEVYDPFTKDRFEKVIKRGKVPIKSVITSFMLSENTGYLKLIRFAETSSNEVEQALRNLKVEGAENIVFDLRDNPGGLLSAARDISDNFLEKGKLIVFTRDRKGQKNEIFANTGDGFKEGRLVVLINEGSASASEIVAGALQDNDRAIIVGRRSFGKGLVQEEMTLKDGSKIRLTTQRYYTPTGRSIQKPYEEYDEAFIYEVNNKEKLDSSRVFTTPKGKKVFGGGGISPDFKVPFDTSKSAAILYHLSLRVDFDEKAFSYVDNNRGNLIKYSREDFLKDFEVDSLVTQFFLGEKSGKLSDVDSMAVDILKQRIKSFIAYNLFDNGAYLESYWSQDPFVNKAIELIDNDSIFMN